MQKSARATFLCLDSALGFFLCVNKIEYVDLAVAFDKNRISKQFDKRSF